MSKNKFLLVQNADNSVVFEIAEDGIVSYLEKGKLVKVTNQKELAIAFATALLWFVKHNKIKEDVGKIGTK